MSSGINMSASAGPEGPHGGQPDTSVDGCLRERMPLSAFVYSFALICYSFYFCVI